MTVGQHRTHLDFETRSLADLPKVGEHAYAQHFSTQPIMLQYFVPDVTEDVNVFDFLTNGGSADYAPTDYARSIYPARQPGDMAFRAVKPLCPPAILQAIIRGDTFVAHNARFEQAIWYWICHKLWGWPLPASWSCTAARARYWGLRASLDGVTSDLEVANKKDENGKEFINNFCKPRKYVGPKYNGVVKELWYEPAQNPEGWTKGLKYGKTDVYAEKDVDDILPDLPEFEQKIWELDFKMNTRGIPIDITSVYRAKEFSGHYTDVNFKRFDEITSLRPTQRDKVLQYLEQRDDIETLGDLKSKTLRRITLSELPVDLQEVISIRLETSKASIKKLESMLRCTDDDGMARGLFLYGGAHTLRWTAKRVQPQNYTRGDAKIMAAMFRFLEGEFWDAPWVGHNGGPALSDMPQQPAWMFEAGLRFPRPLGALSQAMRGFIAAPKGKQLVAGDYAQIEARVLAWLARCMWLLAAFGEGRDPYVTFGAKYMYHRDYDDCFQIVNGVRSVKGDFKRERQISKSAVLGAGFGLGAPKFVEYCDNSDLIISLDEAKDTIKAYRGAHPEIADYDSGLWVRVESAAITATANEGYQVKLDSTGVSFHVHRLDSERYWLICTLPSGRHIAYYRPKVRLGTKWGRACEILSFRTEWAGRSYREDTYGGKLVENIVQGTARDIMAVGALNVEAAGFPVIGLIHDEIITLPEIGFGGDKPHLKVCELMCQLPPWVTDCPVEAEGATMLRYGK